MPDHEWSSFLTKIPIGYYRLDAENKVLYANHAWLALHGYPSLDSVQGREVTTAYVHAEEAAAIHREIIDTGKVHDAVIELKRPNGERFWASIYASAILDGEGNYSGREGLLIDVTERQMHSLIADAMPVGYYAVEKRGHAEEITCCNPEFAEMFEFESPEAAVGFDIGKLYRYEADYKDFHNRIDHGLEDSLRNREIEVRTINGRTFPVETNINFQRDKAGNHIGRIGVVRDLSKDEPLQRLRNDLGNVLHTFTTGLIAIKSDIESAQAALGPDPFAAMTELNNEIIIDEMKTAVSSLQRSAAKLVESLAEREDDIREPFETLNEQLLHADSIQMAFRPRALRDMANNVVQESKDSLESRNLPREPLKNLRQDGYDVMRIFALARLRERITDVLQMEHELRSLRAYVTTQSQTVRTKRSTFNLWNSVEQAMANLVNFADSRGVEFRPISHASNPHIFAGEREILRVVTNVLHNAVKYSWSRSAGIWIDVRLSQGSDNLVLEIENFGLPIPDEELKSGMIFEFGYRSRLSSDKGRVGTGIGLADARQTLKRYDGRIELQSRPAFTGGDAEALDPFVTTAIITLPKAE